MSSTTTVRLHSWDFFSKAISLLLVCDLSLMGPHFFRMFGSGGLIDRELLVKVTSEYPLAIWPLLSATGTLGHGSQVLFGLFTLTALLAAGGSLFPSWRWTRIALYLSYVVLKQSIGLGTYGVHEFLQIALFYLALWGLVGASERFASWVALAFRVHLCMAYLFAGISKATGTQWWSGSAIWRSINRSDDSGFRLLDLTVFGDFPWLFQALGILTMFFEAFYPLALVRRLRTVFVAAMISMHLGTLLFQGLLIFAPTMITLNVFFFLSAREWDARRMATEVPVRAPPGVRSSATG
ncbi:MAG: hypothetical protein ACXU86_02490 [Archangium sp.]